MTRLTWRLARPNLVSTFGALLVLAATALLVEHSMAHFLSAHGYSACRAAGDDCSDIERAFRQKFDLFLSTYQWMNFVPMFVGVFWGGPLIAREIEHGTHRLAWSQSVTRRRWVAAKVGLFGLGAVVFAALFAWIMVFWLHPLEQLGSQYSRLDPSVYDFSGVVPAAYTLLAFAIGTAAGAVTRKVVPALAVTLAVWLPFRLWFESLRGHLITPLQIVQPLGDKGAGLSPGAWVMSSDLVDGAGQAVVGPQKALYPCAQGLVSPDCAQYQGWHFVITYQPANRFWPLQFVESGIFVGLAALCLGLAVYWTLRRVS